MSDWQTEQLEQVLDDVLAHDAEIRSGADAAGLELDNLRKVVLQREEEVWEACRAEQHGVAKLQSERNERDEIRRVLGTLEARVGQLGLGFEAIIIAGALAFGLNWVTLWLLDHRFALVVKLGSIAVGIMLAFYLFTLLRFRKRSRSESEEMREDREWRARFKPAEELLKQALREKGIRAMLREVINVEDPSYSHTFQVAKAAGLAELRDPLYEIRTKAKERIQHLLATMPGGSIGISGPRGVGKTTLLRYFCSPTFIGQPAGGRRDLRVLISAPVQYDARDFVLQLFSAVCQAV